MTETSITDTTTTTPERPVDEFDAEMDFASSLEHAVIAWPFARAPLPFRAIAESPARRVKWLAFVSNGSEHARIEPTHEAPVRPPILAHPPRGCDVQVTLPVEGGWLFVFAEEIRG